MGTLLFIVSFPLIFEKKVLNIHTINIDFNKIYEYLRDLMSYMQYISVLYKTVIFFYYD